MTGLRPDGAGDGRGDPGRAGRGPARTRTTIDYINAHGSGTKQNDRHETAAFKRSLGEHAYRMPGQLDQVDGRALARRDRLDRDRRLRAGASSTTWCRPPRTCTTPDPECDLDYVPLTAREQRDRRGAHASAAGSAASRARWCSPGRDRSARHERSRGRRHRHRAWSPRTGSALEEYWAGDPGSGEERHRPHHPVRRRPATRPGSPARCPASTPSDHLPSRLLPQTDRMTQLALVAADWALADAGVDPAELPEYDMGVVTASASGGFEFGQRRAAEAVEPRAASYVSAYQSFAWFYAVNTGQISIRQRDARARAACSSASRPAGWTRSAQARRQLRKGTPARGHRRRRRLAVPVGLGGPAGRPAG